MKRAYGQHVRNVLIGLVLLGLGAWLVPSYFSAERYRRRLEVGLAQALHRPVTFRAVSFRLLPRPGFSIEDAIVVEDPEFGSEPFARVERIECGLRWHSLWRARLDFAWLRLNHLSLNVVRNTEGEWNVEKLLRQSGLASAPNINAPGNTSDSRGGPELEAEDARINFMVGANKKPFALTEVRARLSFDPARGQVRYRLAGNPVRSDLALPPPGVVELVGEWTPGRELEGSLNATLRTRGALLYDWVPLVIGHNPEIYGVLDCEVRLTGSWRVLNLEGDSRLTQVHRWEQLPPSDPMPWTVHFRGQFDRRRGRVLVEGLDASFANSHFHLSGSIEKIPGSPELDLVATLERSRLEDLLALGRRFSTNLGTFALQGRVDGMLAIQGTLAERRYGGFVGVRDVVVSTGSGRFPVSELDLRIDNRGARLSPVRVTLAPHVELVMEGLLDRRDNPPLYALVLSAKRVPLRDILRFGRALGLSSLQGLDATGWGTATLRLGGSAWPPSPPAISGRAELRAARLLMPGLTEPLNIPRAGLRMSGDQVVVDPMVVVLGTSIFSGRLQHQGERKAPWEFDVRTDNLSVEQAALWFDVLGRRKPHPLLESLPGLSSFTARRVAASNLFASLNARGRFAALNLTYRALTLKDFQASAQISGRVVRVMNASFRAGGGRGQGSGLVDLASTPARLAADVSFTGGSVQALAQRLPAVLHGARGSIAATGHVETRGLSRDEMSTNLEGQATVHLRDVFLGDFDPLEAVARDAGWGILEPTRGKSGPLSTVAKLEARNRQVALRQASFDLAGGKLDISGTYQFGGAVDLDLRADLRRVRRRWLNHGEEGTAPSLGEFHLVGPMDRLAITPQMRVSRANPRGMSE